MISLGFLYFFIYSIYFPTFFLDKLVQWKGIWCNENLSFVLLYWKIGRRFTWLCWFLYGSIGDVLGKFFPIFESIIFTSDNHAIKDLLLNLILNFSLFIILLAGHDQLILVIWSDRLEWSWNIFYWSYNPWPALAIICYWSTNLVV